MLPVQSHSASGSRLEPSAQRKQKSRMVSFRVGDRASHHRLSFELREAAREVSRAAERLAGLR